jgi:hypothetical protein
MIKIQLFISLQLLLFYIAPDLQLGIYETFSMYKFNLIHNFLGL